jgi:hypothetical protein
LQIGAAGALQPLHVTSDGRAAPALPAGEQLLQSNSYAVCEFVAARTGARARQYPAIYRAFAIS